MGTLRSAYSIEGTNNWKLLSYMAPKYQAVNTGAIINKGLLICNYNNGDKSLTISNNSRDFSNCEVSRQQSQGGTFGALCMAGTSK